ncbi:MAG TPA: DNA polymerase III subunit delta [Chitinispirillaceae bacterium]|nr:DNA polymerase III subunit delta [Chitinispirillaceae bacterium]
MIAQVHILCGDETVGRERAKLKLIGSIKEFHGNNIATENFDMETDDFSALMESVLTPSLFQDVRIFQIHRAQHLNDSEVKKLNVLMDAPPPETYIIIEIDEEKKGKTEYKAVKRFRIEKRCESKESCIYLEFPKPAEYKIGIWLVEQLPKLFNRTITKADADFLVDLVGNDLSILYSELQKIDTHLPSGVAVGHEIVEKIVGSSRQMTAFELAAALAERQFPRALQIIDSLFNTNAFAPAIVSAIYRHFWALYRIRCFAAANPQIMKRFQNAKGFNNPDQSECGFAIGRAAGLLADGEQRKVYPVIIASGIVPQARKFTDQELKVIFKWLLEFDSAIKTGRIEGSQHDLQMLCFKIGRVTELLKDGIEE